MYSAAFILLIPLHQDTGFLLLLVPRSKNGCHCDCDTVREREIYTHTQGDMLDITVSG